MEEKRRLPSWMKAASTSDKVSKPLDTDANNIFTKEEVNIKTKSIKPNSKGLTRKHKKDVSPPSNDKKSFLVKCETKRKKRRIFEKDIIDDSHDSNQEAIVEKKKLRRVIKKNVEEPNHSRKKEDTALSSDEEDEDLTMEDLLSIAKQFVENEKSDTVQQKPHSSFPVSKTSINAPQNTRSPIEEERALHHESNENTRSEITFEAKTMTGDPAQDMLDLLLGPLLKKPIQKKRELQLRIL